MFEEAAKAPEAWLRKSSVSAALVWGHNGRCTGWQANEEAQRSKASEWLSINVYV
jgi:hypothetical protein